MAEKLSEAVSHPGNTPEELSNLQLIDQRVDLAQDIDPNAPIPPFSVILMGKGDFSEGTFDAYLDEGINVVGVVGPAYPKGGEPTGIRLKAKNLGIPHFSFGSLQNPETLKQLKDLKPHLSVGANLTVDISKEVAEIAPLGMVGFHPGSEDHRGVASIPWAIINGETEEEVLAYGVGREDDQLEPDSSRPKRTKPYPKGSILNHPNDKYDKGPIFARKTIILNPDARTSTTAYKKQILPEGITFMVDTTKKLAVALGEGKIYRGEKQVRGEGAYQPPIEKRHSQIDWNESAVEIDSLIKGSEFNPGAWTKMEEGEEMYTLYGSSILEGPTQTPGKILKGETSVIVETRAGLIESQTMRDGRIVLNEKGDLVEKKGKPMPSAEFLEQKNIPDGSVFMSPDSSFNLRDRPPLE